MLAKTHLVFGVAAVTVASFFGVVAVNPVTIVAGLFGSLLPDIDHPKSTFGRKILPVSWMIGRIFGHRGITHSALAVLALTAALMFNQGMPPWCVALILGYLSHLLADWITPMGIPLMWPFKTKYRSPVSIKTGGAGEVILMIVMSLTIVIKGSSGILFK